MKTSRSILLFIPVLFPLYMFSQTINPELYSKQWLDNETRTMFGYDITKIYGQAPDDMATYNYSPITSVAYKPLDSIIADFKKVAIVEDWNEEVIKTNIENVKTKAIGGQIQVYLTRYNEESANAKWYFIVIRSMDDKTKIWEYDFSYAAPQNPVNNGWWNYFTANIPVELPDEFYIYLTNRQYATLNGFKFMVEKHD